MQDFKALFEDKSIKKISINLTKTYILLKQLGIDCFEIFKKKGEEAIVRFSSPYAPQGYSGSSLGFFQKTDKAEMKKFLSLLKDMNANGLKVPINALGVMLKRIV